MLKFTATNLTREHKSTSNTLTLNLQLAVPGQSIENYAQAIRTIPMLTVEKERELAARYREHNDLEAARTLVMSHLRFVLHIANTYRGYGLPQSDLVQEGSIKRYRSNHDSASSLEEKICTNFRSKSQDSATSRQAVKSSIRE